LIAAIIERALEAADNSVASPLTLAEVRDADEWARTFSAETLGTLPSS
jgi:hypothetical protein